MGATYNFSLGFAQGIESKAKTPDRLLKRQPLTNLLSIPDFFRLVALVN